MSLALNKSKPVNLADEMRSNMPIADFSTKVSSRSLGS